MTPPNLPAGHDPESLNRAVLQSLRRDLRDVLVPELSSENTRGTARLLDETLGLVALDLDEAAPTVAAAFNMRDPVLAEMFDICSAR